MTSFLNSITKRKKTAEQIVKSVKLSINSLIQLSNQNQSTDEIQAIELEITKLFSDIKNVYKEDMIDNNTLEKEKDKIYELTKYIILENLMIYLIEHLEYLLNSNKQDTVQIFQHLLRKNINNFIDYLCEKAIPITNLLLKGYQSNQNINYYGEMLFDCLKLKPFLQTILTVDIIITLICNNYLHQPQESNNILKISIHTLRIIFIEYANNLQVVDFITTHHQQFFQQLQNLLSSGSLYVVDNLLDLLSDLLMEPCHSDIMISYLKEVEYLKTVHHLLSHSNESISFRDFQIFKLFVVNPHKDPPVLQYLQQNRSIIIKLLQSFFTEMDIDDPLFEDEKLLLIETLENEYQARFHEVDTI